MLCNDALLLREEEEEEEEDEEKEEKKKKKNGNEDPRTTHEAPAYGRVLLGTEGRGREQKFLPYK